MKNMMPILVGLTLGSIAAFSLMSCRQDVKVKDRRDAHRLYERIVDLTEHYSRKVAQASDSVSWAAICNAYEDSLGKISFSFPPDTDLLLTEGQNDTIHSLMKEYAIARDARIREILYPVVEPDSLLSVDSVALPEPSPATAVISREATDASRNPGN